LGAATPLPGKIPAISDTIALPASPDPNHPAAVCKNSTAFRPMAAMAT
jgi:hypothetical protein